MDASLRLVAARETRREKSSAHEEEGSPFVKFPRYHSAKRYQKYLTKIKNASILPTLRNVY